jgi:flagellar biosynthesis/type III secretory pathway chaperone
MHETQTLIEALQDIIREEMTAYEDLLVIQHVEKQLLLTRELEAFLANLHAKNQTLRAIAEIEARRQALVKQLAPLLHLPDIAITLQQLSVQVPEPYAGVMRQYRMRLQRLLKEVQRSSRENARLVRDSLTLVEEALAFCTNLLPATPTYQPSGTFPATVRGRLLSGTV